MTTGVANISSLNISGASTFGGAVVVNNSLNVTGLATVSTLNVSNGSTFSGAVVVNNSLNVTGLATVSTLNVTGASTFGGAVTVNNNLNVSGNLNVTGNLSVTGAFTYTDLTVSGLATVSTLNVSDGSTFSGAVVVNNSLNVTGLATVSTLNVTGASTFGGLATFNYTTINIPTLNVVTSGTTGYSVLWDSSTKELLANSSKSFVIDHPTDHQKYLVHACLEGPEAGVYYRGAGNVEASSSTIILLPDYVDKIATNFTVHLTAIDKKASLWSSKVVNNKFTVYSDANVEFNYIVYGTRVSIETEPNKKDYIKNGSGPYTWLQKK